jgi:beta-galactosidase
MRFFFVLATVIIAILPLRADSNVMFPPAPEAKPYMDFDNKGFIIDGQRTYLSSGSMHYPRFPRELWHDRLQRLARGGFNTVQTYAFWNYHEPVEGQFNFSGDHDFEAYLDEAQKVGLYVTVRAGPYVCAEWDSGGYPLWLKWKPDLIVRKDNPAYVAAQDAWLKQLLPRVAKHQINKGGNVILVQLENEGQIQGAWLGPTSGDTYFDHLKQDGIDDGLQVPFFMSGYNHGNSPVVENLDNSKRQCPWISTEVWAGWYLNYGWSNYGYYCTLRCNNSIMSRGGDGQNYYMIDGGTNFDSWNDNESAASYDYSAAISETGQPRPIYFALKANNMFCDSFGSILADSVDATGDYKDFASNGRVLGVRKSPNGTVVFVRGLVMNTDAATIKGVNGGTGGSLHIPALKMCHVVLDAPIVPDSSIKIVEGVTNILGIARHGSTSTLIVFGQPGDKGEITLDLGGDKKTVEVDYSNTMPTEYFEKAGVQTLRILSMSRQLSDRAWIAGDKGKQYVVVGPEYVGDFSMNDGKPSMNIERPYGHVAPNQVIVYGPAGTDAQHLAVMSDASVDTQPAPALTDWQVAMPAESAPGFDDSAWKSSDDPQEMGTDGDISAFAWYRATVNAPQAGSGTLQFPGAADHLIVFVNGKRIDAKSTTPLPPGHSDQLRDGKLAWTATGDFVAGKNSIAMLTTHQGRDKAGGYWGQIQHYYPKGIFQPVTLQVGGQTLPVKGWKLHGGLPDPASLAYQPVQDETSAAFFRGTFTAPRPTVGANPIIRLDTTTLLRGTVWINGHNVGRYPPTLKDGDKPLGLYLPECWFAPDGKNTLVIFDEEGRNPAKAALYVQKEESREVIAVSQPAPSDTAFQLPKYDFVDLTDGAQLNTATDRPVTASSSAPDRDAANANDTDDLTIWEPATPPTNDKPAWLQIDLQQPRNLLTLETFWESNGHPNPYLVEGSADGQAWHTLYDARNLQIDPTKFDTFDHLTNATGIRYLKVTILEGLDPKLPFGIKEIRAWDVPHNGG